MAWFISPLAESPSHHPLSSETGKRVRPGVGLIFIWKREPKPIILKIKFQDFSPAKEKGWRRSRKEREP
jgi:hypothetical protein